MANVYALLGDYMLGFLRKWRDKSLSAILCELENKYRILLNQRDYTEKLITLVDHRETDPLDRTLDERKATLIRNIVSSEQPAWAGPEIFVHQANFLQAAQSMTEQAAGKAIPESDLEEHWKECARNYRRAIAVELEIISGAVGAPQIGN